MCETFRRLTYIGRLKLRGMQPHIIKTVSSPFCKTVYKRALKAQVIKEIGHCPFEPTLSNASWPKQIDAG